MYFKSTFQQHYRTYNIQSLLHYNYLLKIKELITRYRMHKIKFFRIKLSYPRYRLRSPSV